MKPKINHAMRNILKHGETDMQTTATPPMHDNQGPLQPIWMEELNGTVFVIDQRLLPHQLKVLAVSKVEEMIHAIQEMAVRGAPLIGASGAYGMVLASVSASKTPDPDAVLQAEAKRLKAARPTAVNLSWAVDQVLAGILGLEDPEERIRLARNAAEKIVQLEVENCRKIGEHGLSLIQEIHLQNPGRPVQILTHCNAGWLACIQYGTATAPMYAAVEAGINIHVWVDETRPLNQGSRLTAWELGRYHVPHTLIVDNAGGHLMQHGLVDIVIVGADRVARSGDAANKIGTYLKALAAHDNRIPFYVAIPSTTFDWTISDGIRDIPIEQRAADEIRFVEGLDHGILRKVLVPPIDSPVANYAFDVTPARLITGLITERGVCASTASDILRLFPERA